MIKSPDLAARAHQAMLDAGFKPDFTPQVLDQAHAAKQPTLNGPLPKVQDLRALLWSSIDNDTSRDLDQVEYVEKLSDGTIRLLVGVADVDTFVPKGSPADAHAASETTSVYTGVTTFPMFPTEFSFDKTSLNPNEDRLALVIELHVRESGEVACHELFRATIRNHAKLAYPSVGAWLENRGPIPKPIADVPGMEAQFRLQFELSHRLRDIRREHGSLSFESMEPRAVVENNEVKDLTVPRHNVAEEIIEGFMVAANVAVADYLDHGQCPMLRRVVKVPKRWDRIQAIAAGFGTKLPATPDSRALAAFLDARRAADPEHFPDLSLSIVKSLGRGEYIVELPGQKHEGHFGLAVRDYAHSTAPNRRFADLVAQRLFKSAADKILCPYSKTELTQIAQRCTEREDAANKVERLMRKIIAANLLVKRIGETFDGIITGATPKGTFVRLLKFPAEGMLIRNGRGTDVGDKVRVKLLSVNPDKGFIDFERLST